MPDAITISCSSDISNLFTRAQHNLDKQFDNIDGMDGVWTGMIPEGGSFPVGSGFAAVRHQCSRRQSVPCPYVAESGLRRDDQLRGLQAQKRSVQPPVLLDAG